MMLCILLMESSQSLDRFQDVNTLRHLYSQEIKYKYQPRLESIEPWFPKKAPSHLGRPTHPQKKATLQSLLNTQTSESVKPQLLTKRFKTHVSCYVNTSNIDEIQPIQRGFKLCTMRQLTLDDLPVPEEEPVKSFVRSTYLSVPKNRKLFEGRSRGVKGRAPVDKTSHMHISSFRDFFVEGIEKGLKMPILGPRQKVQLHRQHRHGKTAALGLQMIQARLSKRTVTFDH